MNTKLLNCIGIIILASIAGLVPGNALAADVFVGYADNLRASGFFPTPWIGDPGVVSDTPPGQSLDAAAIRIHNTSAFAVTISNMTVILGGGSGLSFALWNPLVIPAGGNGVFTQTGSFNFDGSDYGIFGASPPAALAPNVPGNNAIGGCSSPASILGPSGFAAECAANAPVIAFLQDGSLISMTDAGYILDTGGWDFLDNGAFGEDGNESIDWNAVGSTPDRSGTGVPEPATLALLGVGLACLGTLRRRH